MRKTGLAGRGVLVTQFAAGRKPRPSGRTFHRLGTLLGQLHTLQSEISSPKFEIRARGLGLLAGVELTSPDGKPATDATLAAIKTLLHKGFIFLPEGEHANVISLTPPLTITKSQLTKAISALMKVLAAKEHELELGFET